MYVLFSSINNWWQWTGLFKQSMSGEHWRKPERYPLFHPKEEQSFPSQEIKIPNAVVELCP